MRGSAFGHKFGHVGYGFLAAPRKYNLPILPLAAGSRLGPYEIVSAIGAGGMGEVYRARDAKLGREIAIKVLPSAASADPDRRQRFEQEARSASALNHPNILTIYDIGSSDETVYIAMELIEGKTLRELIATSEPLPTRKLLDVAVQIAEGLAKAHAAGIVHRDLKPENLMVSKDGFVKILDFGLAKLTEPVAQAASILPTAIGSPTEPWHRRFCSTASGSFAVHCSTSMNEADLALFLDSFESCIQDDRFIRVFYDTFLGSSEEVRALFAQTDFALQRRALRASLYIMVAASARRQAELSTLSELAERHRALRIKPHHYELWMQSLLSAVAQCTEHFDTEVARVWRDAFRSGINYMKAGA